MPQKKQQNRTLRPVRVVGTDALSFVRGGFNFVAVVSKSSP